MTSQSSDLHGIWKSLWDVESFSEWTSKVQPFFSENRDTVLVVNLKVCNEFLERSKDFDSYKELTKILYKDAGLTADVLHIINSALYGFSFDFNDLETAVGLLGPKNIASAIIAREVTKVFKYTEDKTHYLKGEEKKYFKRIYNEIYRVSVVISSLALAIYKHIHKIKNPRNVDFEVVTLGLFCRLADLIVMTYFLSNKRIGDFKNYLEERYTEALQLPKERICFGLLYNWKFPLIYQLCVICDFSLGRIDELADRLLAAFGAEIFQRAVEHIALIESCKILLNHMITTGLTKSFLPNSAKTLEAYRYEVPAKRALSIVGITEHEFDSLLASGKISIEQV